MIRVQLESMRSVADYAQVPCAFRVTSELDVDSLESQAVFTERAVRMAYVKDYDAIPENGPTDWPVRFDTATWQIFAAFDDDTRVGGAVAIPCTIGDVLGPSTQVWDLRVAPGVRGCGIGSSLFEAVSEWSRTRGTTSLMIETQHVNVAACRFYHARGCVIQSITRHAYPSLPHETRIIWRRDL